MRQKLSYESDLGVDLVQANSGYVFTLTNFNETKDKKAFIQQMTSAIADDMARSEYKMDCECKLRYGLFPHEECHQVESRMLPPIVVSFLSKIRTDCLSEPVYFMMRVTVVAFVHIKSYSKI